MHALAVRPITVIEICNPFEPERRTPHTLEPRAGETLDVLLSRLGADAGQCTIAHNGRKIEQGEAKFHAVMPGDTVLFAHTPGGGAMRIVGMVALLAVTTALTGGLGDIAEAMLWGTLGITTAATAAVVAAGIAIGGNLLMSAFLGPSAAHSGAASVTYDPTGPKTLAQPGTPIPKGYGTMGWGGNIISSFVDLDGKDQYLNVLVSFGFGKAKSLTNIFLNQKPITAFRDLTYQVRLGTNDQTPIEGFSRVLNSYPQQIEMLAAQPPVIVPGTGTNTSGLQIGVKFPGGLMRTDSSGDPKECSFAYKIEVSPHNQNAWTAPIFPRTTADVKTTDPNGFQHFPAWVVLPTDRYAGSGIVYSTDSDPNAHYEGEAWSATEFVKVYNIDNTNVTNNQLFQGEWHRMTLAEDLVSVSDWWGGWRIVSDMTDQSFFDVVNVYGLTPGQWDCRITKWGAGPHNEAIPNGDSYMTDPHYTADGWVWVVNEIQLADLAYPNMVLLGIRALATDQLSGANVQVQADVTHDVGEDTVIPSQLAAFETDNPAIVLYDILANPLYGMGRPDTEVDFPSLVRLANYCDEQVLTSTGGASRRWVFGGVFDATGNAWGALQQAAGMCLAQVIQRGNKYAFVVDAPTDVSQVFTEANIKRGSFRESFIAFDDRCNQIECDFADGARNWRSDLPASVITAEDINGGQTPKISRTRLLGCTSRDQAWRWAYFHLRSTNTLLRTVKFSAALEAVTCERGAVIGLQTRQWGTGGRVQPGSTAGVLMIDRTDLPAFTAGAGWTVGVIHPLVVRGATVCTGTVAAPGANTVAFSALPGGRLLKVVTPAGVEVAIRGVGDDGRTVLVDDATVFAAGQQCTFFDQDVFDAVPVSGVNGAQVSVAQPFLQTPAADAPWVYQSGGAAVKLFRVTDIKRASDFDFDISALEYNEALYSEAVPEYGLVVGVPKVQAAVTNVALVEKFQRSTVANAKSTQSIVAVNWDNGPNTSGALVYGSVDGSRERLLQKVAGTQYSFPASTGDKWSIRVVGVDTLGRSASHNDAPTASLSVQGHAQAPAAPGSLTGNLQNNALLFTWGFLPNRTWEIRYNDDASNDDWNQATTIVTGLKTATYTRVAPGNGLYMLKAIAGGLYSLTAATFYLQGSSASLNAQASIIPNQALLVSASVAGTTATLNMAPQSLIRSDGTAYQVLADALTFTGLAANTTYYFYTYLQAVTGVLQAVVMPPGIPDTSPNPRNALLALQDGRYPGPILQITTGTGTTGGSYTGGNGGTCPDAREEVISLRGVIPAGDVAEGDYLLGRDLSTGAEVYRRVKAVRKAKAWAWYTVDGYRMSPLDPVYVNGAWRMPYECGTPDHGAGVRVKITIEGDGYDAHNYYLTGRGTDLLIHNIYVNAC